MTSSVNFTSRLLNYVEPYFVDGVAKSAFYSEVNTNLKRNDKVFILNGFHDSEVFISKGKYVKNADGYKVLFVDRCKIVLDIDFKGVTQSYSESEFDKFIKVYHIRSQREFDYINKIYVDTYTHSQVSKFEFGYTNNIIYTDEVWNGYSGGIGSNSGLTTNKNFWAKSGTTWINVTNQFNTNSFTFSNQYYARGLTNNGRIYILGEDIKYDKTYKERNIYKFTDPLTVNSWKIDIEYKQPIITKLNFRTGMFRGIHNDGIFGSYLKEENWYGTQSKWNSGFFVNSVWNSGTVMSKSDNTQASFYAILDSGKPVQNTDFSNNRGFGYNYFLDSNIVRGEIRNGNFINCNLGTTASGLTAINEYVLSLSNQYPLKTLGGLYNFCDIYDSELNDSTTLDSIVDNTHLVNTRMINSQFTESFSEGGKFSNENAISVITADLCSYIPSHVGNSTSTSSNIRGAIKLYIDDVNYLRLDSFDNFYITRINKEYIISSLSSDQKILLPYETRYVLDSFWDFRVSGDNQQCLATLKTKFDNKSKPEVRLQSGIFSNSLTNNLNNFASIDIDLSQFLAYYFDVATSEYIYVNNQMIFQTSNIKNLLLNTSITNADFRNGVMKGVTWDSGSNVNYPSNIIKINSGVLKISRSGANLIDVYLNEFRPTIADDQLKIGTYVWLDSIHFLNSTTDINISGVYKIENLISNSILNETVINLSASLINSLPLTGYFAVPDNLPNYVSINKLIIDNSEIKSGLFTRTLFKNSTFSNEEFNNFDVSLTKSNIEKLRVNNVIFRDNNNTVKNGLIFKSHIINTNWIGGIANNTIWKGATFGNGVFIDGYWERGTFQNGFFYNSRETTLSSPDYSALQHYKNWMFGTFNDGVFYNSIWIDGYFKGGKLYNSDWYSGTWSNGVLGDKNVPTLNTNMARFTNLGFGSTQTFWYDGIVENAQVGGDGFVYWFDGKFNNGVFTSNGSSPVKQSIWYDGEFNGGDFSELARWKDGVFNKGKFTSYYGWTMNSTYSYHYSWENGKFNGGQFGNSNYATNSTWFYGEFTGGIFQARIWNDGIFQNGTFNGGATYRVLDNESTFTESFTHSYYGLWKNGWVTNLKQNAVTNEFLAENNLRSIQTEPDKNAKFNNVLWLNGIFNHPQGEMVNSAWLSGRFKKGIFTRSVFNPYVKRSHWDINIGTYSSFNLSQFDCSWEDGNFNGGNFYISDWKSGNFLNGTMSGARWFDGVWQYGSALNIYWENGVWKNGMWNGSPFDYNNLNDFRSVNKSKENDILLRVANINNSGLLHLINAFTGSYDNEILSSPNPISFSPPGWTFSDTSVNSTNWQGSSNGLLLTSGYDSNPQMNRSDERVSSLVYKYYVTVLGTVNSGDTYRITISIPSSSGTIDVVADASDTTNTIAQKLSNKINEGLYNAVVESGGSFVIWSNIGGDFTYPYSTVSLNELQVFVRYAWRNYPWQLNISTQGVRVGSYTASEILYALTSDVNPPGFTTSIFNSPSEHSISLTVTSEDGRTDFAVFIGKDVYYKSISSQTETYNFNYTPNGSTPKYFGVQRIIYTSPQNSIFTLNSASVRKIKATYDRYYNNKLYLFSTQSSFNYGPTGTTVSLPSHLVKNLISDNGLVSVNFGNGAFKSGIWENGIWNNGWRGNWNQSDSVVMFTDLLLGSVIEVSLNTWQFKLVAFSTTNGLNVGDKISIGNIVYKDVNEERRLTKDYFRITEKDSTTITVQISINTSIRDIVKDSEHHMIYVTKNIWLSGIFYNGFFEGVWNYGLFKGYPYITVMNNTQWIDGVFDGGRFIGTQSKYFSIGRTFSYNTSLIQNFTFRDNNYSPISLSYSYGSWIDVTFVTYSMSNLFRDNITYNSTYNTNIADGNLRGYPTNDVLSSNSIFRNSFDANNKSYRLGSKFKIYTDFIGDGSKFNYPINSAGLPGVSTFLSKGWTYSNQSSTYSSNMSAQDENVLLLRYTGGGSTKNTLDNTLTRQIEKSRYSVIDFNIIYNDPSITTSTTTTTTTTSGSVTYTTILGLYPVTGAFSNASINITNNSGATIYLYLVYNSGGNSSGTANSFSWFNLVTQAFASGPFTNYGQNIVSTVYFSQSNATTIQADINKSDNYTSGASVRVAYSTTPGGSLTYL
jgi:hypothetical protein